MGRKQFTHIISFDGPSMSNKMLRHFMVKGDGGGAAGEVQKLTTKEEKTRCKVFIQRRPSQNIKRLLSFP